MKAAQVGVAEFDGRIGGAEYLATENRFAAEVLRFYSRVAKFQKEFYADIKIKKDTAAQLTSRPPGSLRAPMPSGDADLLFSRLKSFLSLLAQAAPPTLATAARDISKQDAVANLALLNAYWDLGGMNDQFIAAFAQFIPRAFAHPLPNLLPAHTSPPPPPTPVPRRPPPHGPP